MDAWTVARYTGPRRWVVFWMVMLMLVTVQFFALVPLLPLSEGNMSFATFFLVVLALLLRTRKLRHKPTNKEMKPLIWLLLSVLLSFIPAYVYYRQPFLQSFFTYRKFFFYLILPLLLTVRPTKEEIRKSFYIFSVIWLVMTIIVSFYLQSWVEVADGRLFIDEGDLLHCLPGGRYIGLSFILALDHYLEKRSADNLVTAIFMFCCVFVILSRTILAASMAIIVLATMSGRTVRAKVGGLTALFVFFIVFTNLALDRLDLLIEETSSQVVDVEYNRNKAFIYMFSSQRNIWTILFGNGFISGHVDSIIYDLQEKGIYHSDVGLIGMWHQFGLISVSVIVASAINGVSRDYSFIIRAFSVYILLSALTIGYFALSECIFWICLYWYLLSLESESVARLRRERKIEKANRRQRYRSLTA